MAPKKLDEYKNSANIEFKETTISFLIKDQHILLAMKKRGFGQGKWNGVGGKKEAHETIMEAAVREAQEEISVVPKSIVHQATIYFYMPHDPAHNQKTSIFIIDKWQGKPTETEEMNPKWFHKNKIPYESMWSDDYLWLPKILNRQNFTAEFLFDETNQIIDYTISDNF